MNSERGAPPSLAGPDQLRSTKVGVQSRIFGLPHWLGTSTADYSDNTDSTSRQSSLTPGILRDHVLSFCGLRLSDPVSSGHSEGIFVSLPQVEDLLRQAVPVFSHRHRGPQVVGGDVAELHYEMFYSSPAIVYRVFPVNTVSYRAGQELD